MGGEIDSFAPIRDNKNLRGIRGLLIYVKVGARSPRPHLFGVFSDRLLGPGP